MSKLFNVPLLNITTSFVAEEQALINTDEKNIVQTDIGNYTFGFSEFFKKRIPHCPLCNHGFFLVLPYR